jgi:hypothetical protein
MNLTSIFQSKTFRGVLYGMGITIVLLIVFQAGAFVGYKKATFSYEWGDNYYKNFAGPDRGFIREFEGRDLMNPHGVVGSILKIEDSTISIKGPDNVEKIIQTTDKTLMRRNQDTIKITDLKIDENIVVIGSPNEAGMIEAKLIRVMPLPPPMPQTQSMAEPQPSTQQ